MRYWIVAIELDLERDWTWDGLTAAGFTVLRGGPTATESSATAVGSITIPRVLGASATAQPSTLERSRTHLIFLDAIDPQEATGSSFPESLQNRWFVKPSRTQRDRHCRHRLPPRCTPAQTPLTGTDTRTRRWISGSRSRSRRRRCPRSHQSDFAVPLPVGSSTHRRQRDSVRYGSNSPNRSPTLPAMRCLRVYSPTAPNRFSTARRRRRSLTPTRRCHLTRSWCGPSHPARVTTATA